MDKARGGDTAKVYGQLLVDDCPICLSASLGDSDASLGGVVRTPCGHLYHYECLKLHLASNQFCPLCHATVTTEELQPVEASSADSNSVQIVAPARIGVLAKLMYKAAEEKWNSSKPSPPFHVKGEPFVIWHAFLPGLQASALNVQKVSSYRSSSPAEQTKNKLGITLHVKGNITAPEPGGLYTLRSLMVDGAVVKGPFEPGDFFQGMVDWISVLTLWEAILSAAFREFICPDCGTGPSGAPFTPEREVAGPGGATGEYLGHVVHIPEGGGFYRDAEGDIVFGWHGSSDPPLDQEGNSLFDWPDHPVVLACAAKSKIPACTVSSLIEYLKLKLLLEKVHDGSMTADDLAVADEVESVSVARGIPTSKNPDLVAVGKKRYSYAFWLVKNKDGINLMIQNGVAWQQAAGKHGKFGLVLDNRNMQIRYILVDGQAIPDRAMPKDGALMRGKWKPQTKADNSVRYMGELCCRLLSGLEVAAKPSTSMYSARSILNEHAVCQQFIRKIFRRFDANNNKNIGIHEASKFVKFLVESTVLAEPAPDFVKAEFRSADKNKNGGLNDSEFEDFLNRLLTKMLETRADDVTIQI